MSGIDRRMIHAFTEQKEGSPARNANVWEVAFAEWEGFRTAAFYDHFIIDEERWTDLEEAPAFSESGREGVEELLHEVIASLIPEFGRAVIFTPISAEYPLPKPEDVSRFRWVFSMPRTKMRWVLERRYRERGVQFEFVGRYFQWLSFRENQTLLRDYFWRLGRMPDDVPDMMFVPEDSAEPDLGRYVMYRALIGRFYDLRVPEIDMEKTREMFRKMRGVVYALDGHIFYTTTRESLDELKSRAAVLASQFNLKVAEDLVPIGLRGVKI
ncbi:MAG: hypothetical protein ACYS8W_01695 [Planctomycetota bacterium]